MKKQNRKEFYLACLAFFAVLSICDIAYLHVQINTLVFNSKMYERAAMMAYPDGQTGKTYFIPIYLEKTQ